MKRLLLSLLTVMFGVAMSFAAEVTIETNATASTWTGAADTGFTTIVNGFEVSYLKGGYTSNLRTPETDHIRVYKDAEFIVTNTSNLNITKMVINTTSDTNTGNMTANTGAVSFDTSAQTITWEGNAASVTLTATLQTRIKSVVITYDGVAPAVLTPTFNPASGTYNSAQNVTISCETEGASIYYTLDGTDPSASTTAYTAPVAITETTVLRAIAIKGEDQSAIALASYVINNVTEVSTLAAFIALDDATVVKYTSELTVTYQNGQRLFVTDGTNYTIIYGNVGKTYTNGMKIPAGIEGTKTTYNGLIEFEKPVASTFAAGIAGDAVAPQVITIDQLTIENQSMYFKLNKATYTAGTGSNGTLSVGGTEVATYNQFGITIPEDLSKTYDVTGIITVYKNALQIYLLDFEEAGTGIKDINASAATIISGYNQIEIQATENAQVTIVNAMGQGVVSKTVSAGSTTVGMAPGFYIVKVGDSVTKVVVK